MWWTAWIDPAEAFSSFNDSGRHLLKRAGRKSILTRLQPHYCLAHVCVRVCVCVCALSDSNMNWASFSGSVVLHYQLLCSMSKEKMGVSCSVFLKVPTGFYRLWLKSSSNVCKCQYMMIFGIKLGNLDKMAGHFHVFRHQDLLKSNFLSQQDEIFHQDTSRRVSAITPDIFDETTSHRQRYLSQQMIFRRDVRTAPAVFWWKNQVLVSWLQSSDFCALI